MTTDILALAHDVNRLFRARQDGWQALMGGQKHHPVHGTVWLPCEAEKRACDLSSHLENGKNSRDIVGRWAAGVLRTRHHVAMLGLTERPHFEACLSEACAEGTTASPNPFVERTARYLTGLDRRLKAYLFTAALTSADVAPTCEEAALAAALATPVPEEDAIILTQGWT